MPPSGGHCPHTGPWPRSYSPPPHEYCDCSESDYSSRAETQHDESDYRCSCAQCLEADRRHKASCDAVGKVLNLTNINNVLFATFFLRLGYNIVCRSNPADVVRNLFVDVSDAASSAMGLIFTGPFKAIWIISEWLSGHCLLLLNDVLSLFRIVPTIGWIALRLAGAWALTYWLGPILLLVFVAFPINRFYEWTKTMKRKDTSRSQPPPGYEDWLAEVLRQHMTEKRAEEERRRRENSTTSNRGRGRGKRAGRRGGRN